MKIVDLHNDFLSKKTSRQIKNYISQNSCFVETILSSIWTTELKNPQKYILDKKSVIDKINEAKVDIKLCIEDLWFLSEKNFDFLKLVNPLYCSLTWNNNNSFAGGAYSNGHIKSQGKKLIWYMQQNNIIVDTAHLNHISFNEFVDINSKPIFCSHSGFCSVVLDKRNFDNKMLSEIVNSNGIFGLYFVGKYISKNKVCVFDIVKNIDYFVNKFGYKNLCIGTDFYGTKDLPPNLNNYSQFCLLEDELKKIGYSQSIIYQIFYKNFYDFCNRLHHQ